jgi:hypothetical protein
LSDPFKACFLGLSQTVERETAESRDTHIIDTGMALALPSGSCPAKSDADEEK